MIPGTPCGSCGVRPDVSCKHRPAVDLSTIASKPNVANEATQKRRYEHRQPRRRNQQEMDINDIYRDGLRGK